MLEIMESPSEFINFDCKPHIYTMLQKSLEDDQHTTINQQTQNLENFLARLEEERLKIDAFKRELPLCMQLLRNAIEATRQQLELHRSKQLGKRPILEEFIPLKTSMISPNTQNNQENKNITADKASWMTSAQLWNQEDDEITKDPQSPTQTGIPTAETEIKLGLNDDKDRNVNSSGGAFLPFSPSHSISWGEGFPELALATSHDKEKMTIMEDHNKKNLLIKENSAGNKEQVSGEGNNNTAAQTHRKARRCWSPDLHRRFVNALHVLGGSQVATPKQIRELMKVDGLTNDEVKSHLQKYRLHTRRPSPSPHATVTAAPQVVFLGGIWVPQEYAAAAAHSGSQAATALYGAHGPTATHHHVTSSFYSPAPGTPQEIYSAAGPPPPNPNYQIQMHHHDSVHHQQIHMYNAKPPLTQRNEGSLNFDIQGGTGDPSESIEDGKSESGVSWKVDSGGENGGEGESNGSTVVSLKF